LGGAIWPKRRLAARKVDHWAAARPGGVAMKDRLACELARRESRPVGAPGQKFPPGTKLSSPPGPAGVGILFSHKGKDPRRRSGRGTGHVHRLDEPEEIRSGHRSGHVSQRERKATNRRSQRQQRQETETNTSELCYLCALLFRILNWQVAVARSGPDTRFNRRGPKKIRSGHPGNWPQTRGHGHGQLVSIGFQ
jgi:hypothetical protein